MKFYIVATSFLNAGLWRRVYSPLPRSLILSPTVHGLCVLIIVELVRELWWIRNFKVCLARDLNPDSALTFPHCTIEHPKVHNPNRTESRPRCLHKLKQANRDVARKMPVFYPENPPLNTSMQTILKFRLNFLNLINAIQTSEGGGKAANIPPPTHLNALRFGVPLLFY